MITDTSTTVPYVGFLSASLSISMTMLGDKGGVVRRSSGGPQQPLRTQHRSITMGHIYMPKSTTHGIREGATQTPHTNSTCRTSIHRHPPLQNQRERTHRCDREASYIGESYRIDRTARKSTPTTISLLGRCHCKASIPVVGDKYFRCPFPIHSD